MSREGPDFIGIGVQRGGTSWLYQCLREHPEVCIPQKEIRFFDKYYDRGIDWYESCFDSCNANVRRGEVSPDYIYSEQSLERIQRHFPKAKLLLVIREPLERAYSAYRLMQAHGSFSNESFSSAVASYPGLIEQSLYSAQIRRLRNFFDDSQISIHVFDDIYRDPETLFSAVCGFIEVNRKYRPKSLHTPQNSSSSGYFLSDKQILASQQALQRVLGRDLLFSIKRLSIYQRLRQLLTKTSVDPSPYAFVTGDIKEAVYLDTLETQQAIGRPLTDWIALQEKWLKL